VSAAAQSFWSTLPLGPGVAVLTHDANGLAAFAKPAGVLSHPNEPRDEPRSLLTARYDPVEECFAWEAAADASGEPRSIADADTPAAGGRLWLLNRLDSATSGVILVAADGALAREIRAQFKRKQVKKIYQALVFGVPRHPVELWQDRLAISKAGGRVRTAAAGGHIPAESRMRVVRARGAGAAGLLLAIVEQVLRDQRREAAGETDQAAGVLRERFDVGARLVVETAEVRVGDQLQEILVALEISREQAEVEDGFALIGAAVFLEPRRLDEVEFAADEGLDAGVLGGLVELDRAVEIAMVGQRERGHAEFLGAAHETIDPAGAIEQAVVGVDVEVDEISGSRHALMKESVRASSQGESAEERARRRQGAKPQGKGDRGDTARRMRGRMETSGETAEQNRESPNAKCGIAKARRRGITETEKGGSAEREGENHGSTETRRKALRLLPENVGANPGPPRSARPGPDRFVT
jgi:hypothetical protein